MPPGENKREGDGRAGTRATSYSPSPTRVKDARHVTELCAELVGHLLMNTLTKGELEEVLAELVEVASDYGFIQSGENDAASDDAG